MRRLTICLVFMLLLIARNSDAQTSQTYVPPSGWSERQVKVLPPGPIIIGGTKSSEPTVNISDQANQLVQQKGVTLNDTGVQYVSARGTVLAVAGGLKSKGKMSVLIEGTLDGISVLDVIDVAIDSYDKKTTGSTASTTSPELISKKDLQLFVACLGLSAFTEFAASPVCVTTLIRAVALNMIGIMIDAVLNPPPFMMDTSPLSLTVRRTETATASIILKRRSGFSGTITTSIDPGDAAKMTADGVTWKLESNVLTLTAAKTAVLGRRTIKIWGTGGGVRMNTLFSYSVDYGRGTVVVQATLDGAPYKGGVIGTVNILGPNPFTGVPVTLNNVPATTASLALVPLTGPPFADYTISPGSSFDVQPGGTTVVTIVYRSRVAPNMTVNATTITLMRGTSGVMPINIQSQGNLSGAGTISAAASVAGLTISGVSFTLDAKNGASARISIAAAANAPIGTHQVTLQARVASVTKVFTGLVSVITPPDVAVSIGSLPKAIRGTVLQVPVVLDSIGGMSGVTALTVTGNGLSTSSMSVSLPSNGRSAVSVSVPVMPSAPLGNTTLTVQAKINGLARTASAVVSVQDKPGITLSASGTAVARKGSGSISATVKSQGGFSGPVNVWVPSLPSGVSLQSRTVTIPANGSSTVSLPISVASNAKTGNYTLTVQATSTVGSPAVKVTFTVK